MLFTFQSFSLSHFSIVCRSIILINMNIGITVYPTYGGSGIVGSELGRELAARGHNVHFISSMLPTRLSNSRARAFSRSRMMSYPLFEHQPYDLALATKMATVARAEKLDLLHVHYAIPHSISAILARESIKQKRYVPVITTLHGTDYNFSRRRPFLSADYALRFTAIGRRDGGFQIFKAGDHRNFRFRRNRSHSEFHLFVSLQTPARIAFAPGACAGRRKTAGARFKLPRRQASARSASRFLRR
jgi:glycosyltransferase involved in cell wall biosynthesis